MRNGNGNERDVWVMVDYDGHKTLYQLVEVGKRDALRLARELHACAVVVDIALPALAALDEMSEGCRQSGNPRLILLNVARSCPQIARGGLAPHASPEYS
jgi:hypothetical protein